MIISDSSKWAYVHLKKTAGTAFWQWLQQYRIPHRVLRFDKKGTNHSSIYRLGDKHPDYFKFSTIRNPLTWYKSWYHRAQHNHGGNEMTMFGDITKISLEDWTMKALYPKENLDLNCEWIWDISADISLQDILDSKLDTSWLTMHWLIQLSKIHPKELLSMTEEEVINSIDEILGVDYLFMQETFGETIMKVLAERTLTPQSQLNNPIVRRNTGVEVNPNYKSSEVVFSDTLQNEIRNRDKVFYDKFYNQSPLAGG